MIPQQDKPHISRGIRKKEKLKTTDRKVHESHNSHTQTHTRTLTYVQTNDTRNTHRRERNGTHQDKVTWQLKADTLG